jgi:hypothetical protein
MADQPKTTDEQPPASGGDHLVHPDGMNPHFVPEEEPVEEKQTDDDA